MGTVNRDLHTRNNILSGRANIRIWLLVYLIAFWSVPAFSQGDLKITLQPPGNGEFYVPSETLRLEIAADVPVKTLERLALELDNIDVTSLITREQNFAIVQPPQPMKPGYHQIRLVEYTPDGSILEWGNWRIEVRRSRYFQESIGKADTTVNASHRVEAERLSNLPDPQQQDANFNLDGRLAGDDWQISGNSTFLYNSLSDSTINGRSFDVGDFFATGTKGAGTLDVGQQILPLDNMVVKDFQRRGVSAAMNNESRSMGVRIFAMRTDQVTGFDHGLGVGSPEDRVTGILGSMSPISGDSNNLSLSATYLTGEGSEAGQSAAGGISDGAGDALSIVADGNTFNNRVRLRGEYAESHFDFDGPDTGFGKERDNAIALLAVYTGQSNPGASKGVLGWNAGIDLRRVGTYFHSLANPNLPTDKKLMSAFGNVSWSQIQLNGSFAQETDNVDNFDNLPRYRTNQISTILVYTPQFIKQYTLIDWFGRPSITAAVNRMSLVKVKDPVGVTDYPAFNQDMRIFQVQANFSREDINWGVMQSLTLFDDKENLQPDQRTDETRLNASIRMGDNASLSPSLQWSRVEDESSNIVNHNKTANIESSWQILPNKLAGNLSYSVSRNKVSDSANSKSVTWTGGVDWTLVSPSSRRVGVWLWMNGSYQNDSQYIATLQDAYQIFAGIRVSATASNVE
jgi:hypothetical protein